MPKRREAWTLYRFGRGGAWLKRGGDVFEGRGEGGGGDTPMNTIPIHLSNINSRYVNKYTLQMYIIAQKTQMLYIVSSRV